jgi:hypothetical protein
VIDTAQPLDPAAEPLTDSTTLRDTDGVQSCQADAIAWFDQVPANVPRTRFRMKLHTSSARSSGC